MMGSSPKTVRRKLVELMLGMSFSLLALTLGCVVAYEVHSYRQSTARSLSTIAEIIAENSAAVLMFDDETLGRQILSGLRAEPEISAAALYDQNGKLYAVYPQDLSTFTYPPLLKSDGTRLGFGEITLSRPVMQGDTRVGTVVLEGDLRGTYGRLGIFALVVVAIGIASTAVAFALSQYVQRRISAPLVALTHSARKITSESDYSLRAVKTSDDEYGELTDTFNEMLDQIHTSNQALHEQEERFRTLADNMIQLAWMVGPNGEFLWYNKRWYDYSGLDLESSKVHGWDLVHPEHRARIQQLLKTALEQGSTWEATFPLRGSDGNYRWFLSSAIPIRDGDGRVYRWFGTNTDVTDLREAQLKFKQARDEAVAASRAKDDFLAKLSHELRTPLSPVLLIVSEQSGNPNLPADIRADFTTIRNNIELEARLIDDLLDLTAIVRGKLVLHRSKVRINGLVRDAIAKIAPDAAVRKVAIASQLDPANPLLDCDATRVQQAIWNVLKNAVKFSHDRGTVAVTTRLDPTGKDVIITISDAGIGMAPDELARVFDAFTQGHHAEGGGSHQFGGLGLGLAIARSVIELHSGRITATSGGPDRGSTFAVQLPVSTKSPAVQHSTQIPSPEVDQPQITDGRALSVLLAEDHEPTRKVLHRLLVRRNFAVTEVASASEARAVFAACDFDLLVSDIGLPDGSGYDLMQEFGKRAPIVGIAVTGYGMDADIARAQEAGFCVHLIKPVKTELLDDALKGALTILQEKSVTPPSDPQG